jgi:iron(III) transport system permease protein
MIPVLRPSGSVTLRLRAGLRSPWFWAGLGTALFLLLFLIYPLGLLWSFIRPDHLAAIAAKPYYRSAVTNSLLLGASATLLALLIGVPLAYLTVRTNMPFRGLIRFVSLMAMLSPPFVGAYAWIILLGRSGLVTRALGLDFSIYGWHGILLVFTLQYYPYVFLLTAAALRSVDASMEEAARSLGGQGFYVLRTVSLPLVLPAMAAGALLVFMTSLADFGTPMLIGEGFRMLPVLIYGEFVGELGSDPGMAAALSLVIVGITLLAVGLHRAALGRRQFATAVQRAPAEVMLRPAARTLAALCALAVSLLAAAPQVTVLVSSFVRTSGPVFTSGLTLGHYSLLLRRWEMVWNTFRIPGTAVLVMVAAGALLAFLLVRRPSRLTDLLDGLLSVPHVVPGTVIGVSLIVAWGRPPLPLTGTAAILVIAYILRKVSYTVRASAAALRQVDPALEEASVNLGVPPLRSYARITARLMLPGVLSGAVLAWVTTANELSSTIMLYHARTATLTIGVYNQVLSDSFGSAAAFASVLTLLTLAAVVIAVRLSGERGTLI